MICEDKNLFYSKINFDEYKHCYVAKRLPFNNREKESIKKVYGGHYLDVDEHYSITINSLYNKIMWKDMTLLHVYKLKDEWYYVIEQGPNDEDRYYKCDQLEGAIECIKDIHRRLKDD